MVNVKARSVAKRKAEGFGDISSFMKRRRGRPKKRATIQEVVRESAKPRRVSAVPKRKNTTPAASAISTDNTSRESKKTRTNWSKGEDAKRMAMAVEDWLGKKGNAVDE
eukprot:897946_1